MLTAVARWIFFSFFIGFAAGLVADALVPVKNPRDPEEMVANWRVANASSDLGLLKSHHAIPPASLRPGEIDTRLPAGTRRDC